MERQFKVLLIEDNPGDAFLIKFYLEEESAGSAYELEHTEFLEEGLQKLEANSYDVVLLDLGLPDCSGLETLKKLLEHSPESLVIVLTGLTDEETGVKTVQMGAQDFLVKGQFDGKVLNQSIRFASERFKFNQQLKEYSSELTRYKRQFENTQRLGNLGYWELHLHDNSVTMTDELQELLRITHDQFNDSLDGFLSLVNTNEKQKVEEAIKNVQQNEQQEDISFTMTHDAANGQSLTLTCQPGYDKEGNIIRVAGIISKNS